MSAEKYLANVYKVTHGEAMRDYYDRWAEDYEAELLGNGYATPLRCAQALARHVKATDLPIMDFACGTGLAGAALFSAGFRTIDGMDISAAMLEQARKKSVYRRLLHVGSEGLPDLYDHRYGAIVSAGGIGAGAAPGVLIDALIDQVAPGGRVVLSLNDQAVLDDDFGGRVHRAVKEERIEILEDEDGPHLPGLELRARVFVLARTPG